MHRFKKPLKQSILKGCIIYTFLLCAFLSIFTYRNLRNSLYQSYEERINDILVYIHSQIDLDDLAYCTENLVETPKYKKLMTLMDEVVEQFNIHYLYIIKPLNANEYDNVMIVLSATTNYER